MPTEPAPAKERITSLLKAWRRGEPGADSELLPLVYDDLRRRAARYLGQERPDHTLQPTALVHEAYLRLVDQEGIDWNDRAHFFAFAARVMRQVLIDHARRHRSAKRGLGRRRLPLEVVGEIAADSSTQVDLLALDEALSTLAAFDREGAEVVELRFFAGLSIDEAAAVLQCSPATVVRRWRAARAWLFHQLAPRHEDRALGRDH